MGTLQTFDAETLRQSVARGLAAGRDILKVQLRTCAADQLREFCGSSASDWALREARADALVGRCGEFMAAAGKAVEDLLEVVFDRERCCLSVILPGAHWLEVAVHRFGWHVFASGWRVDGGIWHVVYAPVVTAGTILLDDVVPAGQVQLNLTCVESEAEFEQRVGEMVEAMIEAAAVKLATNQGIFDRGE